MASSIHTSNIQKAINALSFVPSDDRDTWVRMGMAVKSEFGESGFDAWDQWSQVSDSYKEADARAVWRSMSEFGKVRIGTLFHEAAAQGWRDNGEHRGAPTLEELREKSEAKARRDAAELAEVERKQAGYREAAKRAVTLINACDRSTHYYLNSKGLPEVIGLVAGHVLIVPMRNLETNAVQGAQTIEWIPEARQWEKKMIPGMRAKGAVLRLGNASAPETFLCEGYATGLSIELALRRLRLNASVLICFSDSNMAHVSTMVKGRAFVVADNDVTGAGEKSAKKTGFNYCMSPVVGEDFNDYHQRAGLMAASALLMGVRRTKYV